MTDVTQSVIIRKKNAQKSKVVPGEGFEPSTFGFPWRGQLTKPYESDAPPG